MQFGSKKSHTFISWRRQVFTQVAYEVLYLLVHLTISVMHTYQCVYPKPDRPGRLPEIWLTFGGRCAFAEGSALEETLITHSCTCKPAKINGIACDDNIREKVIVQNHKIVRFIQQVDHLVAREHLLEIPLIIAL